MLREGWTDIMKTSFSWLCTTALLLCMGNAWAQDDESADEAETTIRLMTDAEAELPGDVTADIALPDSVPEDAAAVENARFGIDTANENRQRRGDGLATAEEARERGAEMAEEARENRENRGRSEERPDRPDPPDRPDVPTPPGN